MPNPNDDPTLPPSPKLSHQRKQADEEVPDGEQNATGSYTGPPVPVPPPKRTPLPPGGKGPKNQSRKA